MCGRSGKRVSLGCPIVVSVCSPGRAAPPFTQHTRKADPVRRSKPSALAQNSPLLGTKCMRTKFSSTGRLGLTRNDVSKTCSLMHLKDVR